MHGDIAPARIGMNPYRFITVSSARLALVRVHFLRGQKRWTIAHIIEGPTEL